MKVVNLLEKNIYEAADVLCEAFYNYPVMKYVLGEKDNYENRLRKAVTFFVSARALRNEPLLGIYNPDNKLIAAATVTLPGEIPNPAELVNKLDILWQELGTDEKARYEKYGNAASNLLPKESHHHLNMIGVRNDYQRKGLARQLINAAEELVSSHPSSTGISLNTEIESNVNFYLHLGFELCGQTIVDANFVTWGFFKSKIKK